MSFTAKTAVTALLLVVCSPAFSKKKSPASVEPPKKEKPAPKKTTAKAKAKTKAKPKKDEGLPWGCILARTSRLSVNSAHQSCVAVKGIKKLKVRDDVCKPVNEKKPKGLKCTMRKPAAAYGGGKRMEVINRLIDPTPDGKTDCSGFVSGVYCRAGARLHPNKNCELTHTAELLALGNTNDCFETLKFTSTSHLRPGCMIIWRKGTYGHVVLVEKVGKDPFGIKAGCDADPQTFNKWNFQIAESATSAGPTIYDARRRFSPKGEADREALFMLRQRLCEATAKKIPLFAAAWEDDLTAKILCHVGSARQGCIDQSKRFFKDEACIAHCTP